MIFNVKNFGAIGDGITNDTVSIRNAYNEVVKNNGGTLYFPQGTYKVCPTENGGWFIKLHTSNVTFLGDGYDKSVLSVWASNMRNPNDMIDQRGGAFTTLGAPSKVENITFSKIRVTGNANVTDYAGAWPGRDMDGWDVTHKALGIWGAAHNFKIEDCEWDGWRGEILYAGGGQELGTFYVTRAKIHDCNASAISMTGKVIADGCEIYDVYNTFENFSLALHHGNEVRNCIIEPNRNFPKNGMTKKVGKFGVTYIGVRGPKLIVENNKFGDSNNGAVFLSDFAHDVTIRNNIFVDTVALYAITLGLYPKEMVGNEGYSNVVFEGNTLYANTKNVEGVVFFTGGIDSLTIRNNTLYKSSTNRFDRFLRIPNGAYNKFLIEGNVGNDSPMFSNASHTNNGYLANNRMRPTYINNVGWQNESLYDFSPDVSTTRYFIPIQEFVDLSYIGVNNKKFEVDPNFISSFPEGFKLTINNTQTNGTAIIPKNPLWNNLTEDLCLTKEKRFEKYKFNKIGDKFYYNFTGSYVDQDITLSQPDILNIEFGKSLSYSLTFSGGNYPLTFSFAESIPSWLTITNQGTIIATPIDTGSYMFDIMVQDSDGDTDMKTLQINVYEPDLYPSLNYPQKLTIEKGYSFSTQLVASGGNGQLLYSLANGPTWVTVSSSGMVSGVANDVVGIHKYTVLVTDTDGDFDSKEGVIEIVSAVNKVPNIVNDYGTFVFKKGQPFSIPIAVSGGDLPIKLTKTAGASWLVLDELRNSIIYDGKILPRIGKYNVTVRATDANGDYDTLSFTIRIR